MSVCSKLLTQSVEALGPVVRRVNNAIHQIHHYPADSVFSLLTLIHWIVIYPADI